MKPMMGQGRGILWLVRLLAVIGLAIVVTTTGLVGWMLTRVRSDRVQAIAEQARLDRASQALRERAVQSRIEIQTALDESAARTNQQYSFAGWSELIRVELNSRPDPAVLPSLEELRSRAAQLTEFAGRAEAWRAVYSVVWVDLRQQKTIGLVREVVTRLRTAVEAFEGRQRLNEALKYRRWRKAVGEDAARRAGEILAEQARRQSRDSADFKNQLAEFARLVELLGGEEQFDSLADLKNNKLKPLLDRMSRSIAAFGVEASTEPALQPQTVEDLKLALFGEGYVSDDAHQNVQVGRGGLFTLRRDALSLRREREKLMNELAVVFQNIEAANARFSHSTQARTTALGLGMENSLEAGWRQMLIFGSGCSVFFMWLAWRISRGINRQVNALEQARAQAEQGRLTTQRLMLEQEAAAAERARLTGILERSLNEIYIFDAHTLRFEYVNEGALRNLGYTLEAMRVKTPLDLKPEFTEAKFLKMIKPLLADEKEKHVFHTIHRRADSSDYPVEVHLQMVAHSGKQVFLAVIQDITERKRAEQELANAQKQLVETSRMAGMAEVATSVLHNVGNVLNSVNVSASLVADKIKKSNSVHVRKVAALLREHESDLGAFLTSDAKGRQVPAFLATLGEAVALEQEQLLKEMAGLQKNIDHIKDVVAMQQSYAKVSAASETVKLDELIEECLRMNAGSLTKHDVRVVREFGETPAVEVDKHKLLQILLNLLSNAKQACDESGREDNQLTLRLACDGDRVRISVSDTGVGVAPENLNRVFNHGFTTKKDGHGFGLHSGANAAREMGGSLTVQSDGPGCGATFILELPVQPRQATQNLQP